jgi:hypothetical protein
MSAPEKMHDDCYIVMSAYGIQRMTKRPCSLKRGEVSVKIRLVIPTKCFEAPTISAVVSVPDSAVNYPTVDAIALDAEVQS